MNDDEFIADMARLAAQADQAKMATKEVAKMLGTFRVELMDSGFERGEALAMCLTLLNNILNQTGE